MVKIAMDKLKPVEAPADTSAESEVAKLRERMRQTMLRAKAFAEQLSPAAAALVAEHGYGEQEVIIGSLLYAAIYSCTLQDDTGKPAGLSEEEFLKAAAQAHGDVAVMFPEAIIAAGGVIPVHVPQDARTAFEEDRRKPVGPLDPIEATPEDGPLSEGLTGYVKPPNPSAGI